MDSTNDGIGIVLQAGQKVASAFVDSGEQLKSVAAQVEEQKSTT